MMKPTRLLTIALAGLLLPGCDKNTSPEGTPANITEVTIQPFGYSTKVSYPEDDCTKTEFQTGDRFGLFLFDSDNTMTGRNVEVYCSGLDNSLRSVWSLYKNSTPEGHSSNTPLSELLSQGERFLAYYPFSETLDDISSPEELKDYIEGFADNLPDDQSASLQDCDLLVASNLPEYPAGEITLSGKSVRIVFSHVLSMLRFSVPEGAQKYEYLLDSHDFTPFFTRTAEGQDEYRYIFKPGTVLDICIKYLHDGKLYRAETGNTRNLWTIITKAGHCYSLDRNAVKIPYETAVDMGTSVMWASFNIGVEDDPTVTPENLNSRLGYYLMWAVNQKTSTVGSAAYTAYNNAFTDGTKPSELPIGSNYSENPAYDAATTMWGGKWRTPTWSEWEELFSACTYTVGDKKITFTSKTTGNSITLPYGGYNNNSPTSLTQGYYWSSTGSDKAINKAKSAFFKATNSAPSLNDNADRYTGLPVRPVYTKSE